MSEQYGVRPLLTDIARKRSDPLLNLLEALEGSLTTAMHAFAPDLVFWIAGADPHEDDRFGQMQLNDAHFAARDEHVLNLVARAGIPTVVLYGGGYNRDREHTARLHAATVLRAATYQNNGV